MNSGKKGILIGIAVVAIIVLACAAFVAGKRNTFYQMRIEVQSAWAQVENQLQRRFDLIPNLVETVKGYAKQEREVLLEVTNARARVGGAGTVPDKIAANNELSGALSRLLLVVERYPDLKSNQNFLKLQDELAGTENRIAVERMRYNQKVEAYNKAIGLFPGNIIAGWFDFKEETFFKVAEAAKETPKVQF
ncbi:MAG TPA: LemA family protein [Smithellaceae bacterium]|mgnify:CR=1 FL=1|nr:LemA family protein [Smithellaceae bacterium]